MCIGVLIGGILSEKSIGGAMNRTNEKTWIYAAILLAVVIVATGLTQVATLSGTMRDEAVPGGTFVSLGMLSVYVTVCAIGGPLGALVGSVGSLFGCLIASIWVKGATAYCIPAFLFMGGIAFFMELMLKKDNSWKGLFKLGMYASAILLVAFFLYDLIIMGDYDVAAKSLPINILQFAINSLVAVPILKMMTVMQNKSRAGKVSA